MAALSPPHGLKLHLGSGPHAEPGWINVDKSWTAVMSRKRGLMRAMTVAGILNDQQARTRWPKEIVHRDLTKRFDWGDNSVSAIYSSHMVEHLDRSETRHLLAECLRVLMPGGVVRLALPSLDAAARTYVAKAAGDDPATKSAAADEFLEFLYFRPDYASMPRLRRALVKALHRPHRWMYDASSLSRVLAEAGFVDVAQHAFREGSCPDLATLETRTDDVFEGSTFFVEGHKAGRVRDPA